MSLEPILIHANAPWCGTGYGSQAALFGPMLAKAGYRVAYSAFSGLQGSYVPWIDPVSGDNFLVYPGGDDGHGNDVLTAHAQHWFRGEQGITFLISDPWVINVQIPQILGRFAAWTPIDHDPLMPPTHHWLLDSGAYPVAMSRFGAKMLEEAGHKQYSYIPHGFNPQVYHPQDRASCRRMFRVPESAFVVGIVAANSGWPSRKCFGEALTAFSIFQRKHKDALLYLYTRMERPKAEDIGAQIDALRIKVKVCDQYGLMLGAPPAVVAATMNTFDVLLNPARGEGFGCTVLEAEACGIPCIVTDWSAMPEVAPRSAGNWNVGGQEMWTSFLSYQLTPSIEGLVNALEEAYADSEVERLARKKSVREHAQQYRADRVFKEFMLPAFEEMRLCWDYEQERMVGVPGEGEEEE